MRLCFLFSVANSYALESLYRVLCYIRRDSRAHYTNHCIPYTNRALVTTVHKLATRVCHIATPFIFVSDNPLLDLSLAGLYLLASYLSFHSLQ